MGTTIVAAVHGRSAGAWVRFWRLLVTAWLSLVVVTAATLAWAGQDGSREPALEGRWDAVLESPKRPWVFVVVFGPRDSGWDARLTVPGLGELPLQNVRATRGRVQFTFPPQFDSMVFDGRHAGATIVGQVVERDEAGPRTVRLRLRRVVPLRAPTNRTEAWQQDLDVAEQQLAAYDRSFTREARRLYVRRVTQLKREVSRRSDAEILVALSRAVALADNGHTRLRLPAGQGTPGTVFPLRVWWFSDGPFVIRASADYARALGCRLIAVNGHDIAEVRRMLSALSGGTAERRDYLNPLYLMRPDVLSALGLIASISQASFTLQDASGATFSLAVRAERRATDSRVQESWQELSPLIPSGNPVWATAIPADPANLPLYLRHADLPYWSERVAGSDVLYVQYNRATNADTGPSFDEFARSLVAQVAAQPPRAMVIDLRLSSGGDLTVAKAFFRDLAVNSQINRPGRLFVITGPVTFSAGLYHAAQLKQLTKATFVGETVGDRLDYWAEGGRIQLPNSGAQIDYANGFHRYSATDYRDRKPYYEELVVTTLAPDLVVPMASADYFARRDRAMETILRSVP